LRTVATFAGAKVAVDDIACVDRDTRYPDARMTDAIIIRDLDVPDLCAVGRCGGIGRRHVRFLD